jgi:hypothetical protein
MKKDTIQLYTNDELKKLHDIYSLWWQYLCQSFWHRKFCEEMHKAKIESAEIPDNLSVKIIEKLESIHESKIKKGLKINVPPNSDILKSYWEIFGNIHYGNFEKWWEKKKDSLRKRCVFDLRDPDVFEFFNFQSITRRKRFSSNRFPTPEEILESITIDREYIFVAIPLRDLTIGEIGKQIAQIREQQKKKYPNKPKWLRENDIMLEGKLEIDELKRYLEYFILKNNNELTGDKLIKKRDIEEEKIANEKGKEYNKTRDEIQRMIYADIKRAEKIIENVEKGRFPGSYQPKIKK